MQCMWDLPLELSPGEIVFIRCENKSTESRTWDDGSIQDYCESCAALYDSQRVEEIS